jgi:type II secretory pathway pseudopilin PulG
MKKSAPIRRSPRPGEEGYILLAVIFMLTLLMISLALAAPKVAKEIQRDREVETMHRGKQYMHAIKLYYKKFGAYPPNVDALLKTSNIRYLRKKYIDPTTGKEEWKPIRFGQAKTQTLGFFGQPIAGAGSAGGSVVAGVGPSGGNNLGSGLGSTGSLINSGTSTGGATPGTNPTDPTSGATPSGTTPDPSQTSGTAGSTGTGLGSTGSGVSGQTFGGVGIIGFSPNSPKQSILVYKKKNHYNEWEFVYDPLSDMTTISSGGAGSLGQSTGTPGNTTGGVSTGGTTTQTPPAPQPTPAPPPQQ